MTRHPLPRVACMLFVALSLALTVPVQAKEKVRVSLFSWPNYGFWYIAKEKNLAPEIEWDIQIIEDPLQSYALVAAGKLDVICSTGEYGPIGAEAGSAIKYVAYHGLSYGTDKIIAGPGIKSAADLKGKSVAVMEGGLSQIYMGMYLESNGLKFNDVTYTNVIMDDAAAAMLGGQAAAGEFWEPYGGQVLANLKGSTVLSNSLEPQWLKTGLLHDAVYMNGDFIKNDPRLAADVMRAWYDAIAYWRANPADGNRIIAEGIKFEVPKVEETIGNDGKPKEGGMYVYSFDEAARFMGVRPGDGPLGQAHGGINALWKTTNDWWVRFGMMKQNLEPSAGIDLTPLKILADEGYGK